MDYPKSVPNVGLVDGKFVDENTTTGQVGSLIPAAWGTSVTEEILNFIYSAGLVPDENDNAQIAKAVRKLLTESGVSFSTKSEAEEGVSTTTAMSPLRVFQAIAMFIKAANESTAGISRTATQALVNEGVDDTTFVSPKKLAMRLLAKANSHNAIFTGEPQTNSTPPPGDNGPRLANTNFVWQEFQRLLGPASESTAGRIAIASKEAVNSGVDDTAAVTSKKIRRLRAAAWVNFNGTGTVSIRDSHNVSSITDVNNGHYTVNFSVPMDNPNYSVVGSAGNIESTDQRSALSPSAYSVNSVTVKTSAQVNGYLHAGNTADNQYVNVVVFGGVPV